jgi:drug/metabolite transporter (DMT)-like permease
LGPGPFLCGIVFFGYKSVEGKRKYGNCGTDLNLKQNPAYGGKVKWGNVFGMFAYSLNYIAFQFLVMTTFALCFEAGMNAGIVSSIWSISPLFAAFFDRLFFNQSLATRHYLGIICLVFSAAAISLSGVISGDS